MIAGIFRGWSMSSEVFSFRALLYFRFSVNFLKFCSFGNFQGGWSMEAAFSGGGGL